MDAKELRTEFEKQVTDADQKITAAEKQLQQLKEYKIKLLGGLETLDLLHPKTEGQEETQDGPPESPTAPTEEPTEE